VKQAQAERRKQKKETKIAFKNTELEVRAKNIPVVAGDIRPGVSVK
jgi:hypothetical protein